MWAQTYIYTFIYVGKDSLVVGFQYHVGVGIIQSHWPSGVILILLYALASFSFPLNIFSLCDFCFFLLPLKQVLAYVAQA